METDLETPSRQCTRTMFFRPPFTSPFTREEWMNANTESRTARRSAERSSSKGTWQYLKCSAKQFFAEYPQDESQKLLTSCQCYLRSGKLLANLMPLMNSAGATSSACQRAPVASADSSTATFILEGRVRASTSDSSASACQSDQQPAPSVTKNRFKNCMIRRGTLQ
eukprot:TRINITY_DN18732_c0_g1_i1.p2 TRINITY_DN18732_c0_g1~~TRINITY_DN18732_c0_g1_i1.p2  ORF type:complete len:167 (-),score=30.15 TRINITY_DN18732_c0_g1_i1:188-688(-)